MRKRELRAEIRELKKQRNVLLDRDRQRDEEWRVWVLDQFGVDLGSVARKRFDTDWVG